MNRSTRVIVVVGAALVASCATPAREAASTAIILPLNAYFRDLRTAQLRLGARRLTFLVDTAGGRTLISEELARTIGCTPSGRDVAYRMTGEPVVFASCASFVASASDFELALRPVAVFDVNELLPPELPKLDGVLALDAFRGHVLTIDWSHDQLIVQAGTAADRALATSGVPIRIATGENGAALSALVPVAGASKQLWFLLDSGNIRGTLVGRYVYEHGLLPHSGESVSIAVNRLPAVSLVPIVDDINLDGVLGTAYLKSQTITVDLRRAP